MRKTCRSCKRSRAESQFGLNTQTWYLKDGTKHQAKRVKSICKECDRAKSRAWRAANRERSRALVRSWKYRNRYGISIEDYEALAAQQGGVCAICGDPPAKLGTNHGHRLKVDHNHETGEVRGLLCNTCNLALGRYERLRDKIEAYLA